MFFFLTVLFDSVTVLTIFSVSNELFGSFCHQEEQEAARRRQQKDTKDSKSNSTTPTKPKEQNKVACARIYKTLCGKQFLGPFSWVHYLFAIYCVLCHFVPRIYKTARQALCALLYEHVCVHAYCSRTPVVRRSVLAW